jgi:tetratricopeptide (TPR) repeat protein
VIRQRATQLPAGDANSRLLTSIEHMRAHQYSPASKLLTSLRRERPRDFFIWFLLGNCHYSMNRFSKADTCFTSAITLWPEFHVPHFHRGLTRLKAKRFAEAEQDFSETLRLEPEHTAALADRALVRIELGKLTDAVDDLSKAIELGRADTRVYLLRARALRLLGRMKDAESDFEIGKNRTPVCVEGWIQRSLAFHPSEPTAALDDLESALAMNPKSRQALQNKAALLSQLGRNQDAIDTLSKLIESHPADATTLLGRGLLKARLGRREDAIADGELGLKLNGSAIHQYQMARLLAQSSAQSADDADRAAYHLCKALQSQPKLISLLVRDRDLLPIVDDPEVQQVLSAVTTLRDAAAALPK